MLESASAPLQNVSHTFMYAFEFDRHCDGDTFIYARTLATHIHVTVISSTVLCLQIRKYDSEIRNSEHTCFSFAIRGTL